MAKKKGGKKTTKKSAGKTAKKKGKRGKRKAAKRPARKAAVSRQKRAAVKQSAASKKAAPPDGVPTMLGGAPTSSTRLDDGEEE